MADDQRQPGRPRLFEDSGLFAQSVEAYFTSIKGTVKAPTMAGLALFLGFCDRHSLATYEGYGEDFSATVKRARTRIEEDRQQRLINKDTFTAGVIFDLKNNHGWRDRTEHELGGLGGGPIQHHFDLSRVSNEQLDQLETILTDAAIPGADQSGEGEAAG